MPDALPPFALPELGRSLRALGALRTECAERAHAAVFGPLLEARAAAASAASQAGMLSALRGGPLAAHVERLAMEAARAGVTDPARGRARAALARELLEPLLAALGALDRYADSMDPSSRIDAYSPFVARLADVFAAADVACSRLSALLSANAPPARPAWLRGTRP